METIETIAARYRSHQLSPVEYVKTLLARIERNRELLAFVSLDEEGALRQAHKAEKQFMKGNPADMLLGIPLGIKDVIDVQGLPTTAGCSALAENCRPADAPVVQRLREQGAVILGKTTPHQLAFGIAGDRSHIGAPKNPYDPARITGGSSGGSACALAAGLCDGALGTDTGGSVRAPAACCGIVGMKPTAGRIRGAGIYPLSQTLDCVGTMSRTVRDNEILLEAVADSRMAGPKAVSRAGMAGTKTAPGVGISGTKAAPGVETADTDGVRGMAVAVPARVDAWIPDPEIHKAFHTCLSLLAEAGVRIQYVEIPELGEYQKARRCIQMHEAYKVNQDLILRQPPVLDPEILERFHSYPYDPHAYQKALTMIPIAQNLFTEILGENQMFLLPTLPILPTKIGQREITIEGKQEPCLPLLSRFMWQANLTGFPAMSLPGGISGEGLPIGIQILGRAYGEAEMYRLGRWIEAELGIAEKLLA